MDQECFRGQCLCEKLQFRIAAPTKWCAHCHCSMCRRAHGAPVVTWVGVPSTQFEIIAGHEYLKWFASSPGARRGFCGECGSSMIFESARWPGETHVTLANITGEVDRLPAAHAFFDTHVGWLDFNDNLKKFP